MKTKKAQTESHGGMGIIIKFLLGLGLFFLLFFGVRYLIKFLTVGGA